MEMLPWILLAYMICSRAKYKYRESRYKKMLANRQVSTARLDSMSLLAMLEDTIGDGK
jgi:hypothetical protein